MWSKLKELVNSKKSILMFLTIIGAVISALVDIITARECLSIICGAVGINGLGINFQDFGKAAKQKEVDMHFPPKEEVKTEEK